MAEFLPLCDVLFNIISLAGYFCDVVFDLIMCYALLERGYKRSFAAALSFVLLSLIVSQILSLKWHLEKGLKTLTPETDDSKLRPSVRTLTILLHIFQLGVLWRYAKLFIPVDLTYVKHQVRNLCILRLVHAFCEAAPMLLLQVNVLLGCGNNETAAGRAVCELAAVSSWLSLFSLCWALASFSKNVRRRSLHRLVFTWLGVIFQLFWRLGTVSARIAALSAYALVYKHWLFLVFGLHWLSMFLWLVSPRGAAGHSKLAALLALVYVFAYINVNSVHYKHKMVTFYTVMCIENILLGVAWACGTRLPAARVASLSAACVALFIAGIANMLLYYRYFHVKRLGYGVNGNQQSSTNENAENCKSKGVDHTAIPGVFNCRFSNPVGNNNAGRRKKKMPSHFVPPPGPPPPAFWRRPQPHSHHGGSSENEGSSVGSRVNIQQKLQEKKQKQLAELLVIEEEIKQGKLTCASGRVSADEIYSSLQRQPIPRAKSHAPEALYQNLPAYLSRLHYQDEHSEPMAPSAQPSGVHLNIMSPNHINNGMLFPGVSQVGHRSSLEQISSMQSSPRGISLSPVSHVGSTVGHISSPMGHRASPIGHASSPIGNIAPCIGRIVSPLSHMGRTNALPVVHEESEDRKRRTELLLTPHYLPLSQRFPSHPESSDSGSEHSCHRASDMDSQISLSRSYTLPREFRFVRQHREPTHHSNNSSDGDVDSADENDTSGGGGELRFPIQTRLYSRRQQRPHETKL